MTEDRHARAKGLFLEVCDLPEEERQAALDRACGDDAELRREVESLLSYHGETEGLPIPDAASDPLASRPEISPDRIGEYRLGSLTLRLTGVGDIEFINLNATSLDIATTGVGDMMLSGTVQDQAIRLDGLSNYDGRDLTSAAADVLIVRGGSATVRVQDSLIATIHGSGNVYYIGNPVVESSISGNGNVIQIGG